MKWFSWNITIIKRLSENRQSYTGKTVAYVSYCLLDSAFHIDTNEGLSKEYKYLNHYEVNIENSDSGDSIMECYILMNQENVTYDEFEKSRASSVLGGAIGFLSSTII